MWLVLALGLAAGLAGCTYDPQRYPPTTTVSSGTGGAGPARAPGAAFQPGGDVVVQQGDSMSKIAARMGVPLAALLAANPAIEAPYRIFPGQRIRLPRAAPAPVVAQSGAVPRPVRAQPLSPAPGAVSVSALPPPAAAARPPALEPGDLPGPDEDVPGGAAVPGTAPGAAPGTALVALPLPRARPTPPPAGEGASAAAGLPATPPRTDATFLWPVRGPIISAFGPKADGLHNDGINIKADAGTPVKAAEAGVVVYAGNELRGFGNLILIKHDGGWVTAYGHNERLLVARGDVVKRGQTIARVGRTGTVTTPQLHFEIRKGRETVDPTKYLAS